MRLKDGMVFVTKRGSWYNTNIQSAIISLVTLSRYRHTGTIVKENDGWYVYQANLKNGVHKTKLYKPWLENEIADNKIDLFEDEEFNKKDFKKRFKSVEGNRYNLLGLLKIGVFNFTGKVFGCSKKRMFCSQLTSYLHDFKGNGAYCSNSPATIAHSKRFKWVK